MANTYYVSTSGDNNDVGSELAPFQTVQFGLNQVAPGDSLIIRGGIYNEALTWSTSGTVNNKIHLLAYPNENPIVDGTGISNLALLSINNKSFLHIEGIQFRNNYQQDAKGIYLLNEGSDISILHCQVYNIGWTTDKNADPFAASPVGQAHGILVNGRTVIGISKLSISNCHVHNIISGNSESLTLVGNVSNFELKQDTVRDTKNIGIVVAGHYSWAVDNGVADHLNQARNGLIQNCLVYSNRRFSDLYAPAGIYVDGGRNVIVHGNTSYSNGNGLSIGCENVGKSTDSIQVVNNMIYQNDKAGVVLGSNAAIAKHVSLKNNTIVENGTLGDFYSEVALQNLDSCEIIQNIIIPVNSSHYAVSIFGYIASNLLVDNNLVYRYNLDVVNLFVPGSPAQFVNTNTLTTDPLFEDILTNDFHLMDTSPAIDTGLKKYPVIKNVDVQNDYRLINGKIDLGAYEHPFGACPDVLTIDSTYIVQSHFHANDSIIWESTIVDIVDSVYFHTPIMRLEASLSNLNKIVLSSDGCVN